MSFHFVNIKIIDKYVYVFNYFIQRYNINLTQLFQLYLQIYFT